MTSAVLFRRSSRCVRWAGVAAVAALAVGGTAAPAAAHVGVTATETAAGAATVASFAVGHGCEGSPTESVTFTIPEELGSVAPVRNPGWSITVTRAESSGNDDAHGADGRVTAVQFTADEPLEDGIRDSFSLAFTLPEKAGTELAFPTVQTCAKGELDWTQVAASGQDPHDLESPAPLLVVAPAADESSDHAGPDDSSTADEDDRQVGTVATGILAGLALVLAGLALARSRRT